MRTILRAAASAVVAVGLLAATLLVAAPEPSRAHISEECDHTLSLTVRLAEGKARVAGWIMDELNTFRDVEEILSLVSVYMDTDTLFMESSQDLIECLNQSADAAPADLDWLDDVTAGLDEPPEPEAAPELPPQRVTLGVDCDEPLTVGLPDDVLTECE